MGVAPGLMQSPQIAARSPTPSLSPTRGEGSWISFWCEIPPLPLWERGQGERGFTDFASALSVPLFRLYFLNNSAMLVADQ